LSFSAKRSRRIFSFRERQRARQRMRSLDKLGMTGKANAPRLSYWPQSSSAVSALRSGPAE
jgi:hypothetical protein